MKTKHYLTMIAIVLIDQITKVLMINKNIVLIPNIINLTYTENKAGAFGLGKQYIILILSIIIILGLIFYIVKNKNQIRIFIPFILILAGSIGNLIDRVFRGFVIDFIDINLFDFPNFNIADTCIVIGIFFVIFEIVSNTIKTKLKNQ